MRTAGLIVTLVFLATIFSHAQDQLVPAGTLLRCTLDEPEVSSKTLNRGDPVLCQLDPVNLFGNGVFPSSAYLAGRFENFRSPGHFYGKGWMKLSFDRVLLPDEAVPISAKVVGASHVKVDRSGDILGRGHPQRDLLGWMAPPLWPVKIFTLPMRGPTPAIRGETSLILRLMQDLVVPATNERVSRAILPPVRDEGAAPVVHQLLPAFQESQVSADGLDPIEQRRTVLALKNGTALIVADYWVDNVGRLRLTMAGGRSRFLPVSSIDFETTVTLNRQRGVKFILKTEPWESSQ